MDDHISEVRVFDESRLDFVPCSLYLAMDFARQAIDKEQQMAARPENSSVVVDIELIKDAEVKKLMKELLSADSSVDPFDLSSEIMNNNREIVDAVRDGKPAPLPKNVQSHDAFVRAFVRRVEDLLRASGVLVYGVGIIECSLNNLSPCVQRRIRGTSITVKRENYRVSSVGEKRCVLLNAVALEGFNFLSSKDLKKAKSRSSAKKHPFSQKKYFSLLDQNGSSGYMVYSFDMKSSK